MSKRATRRAKAALNTRRQDYEALKDKHGFKRPGSLNPRKRA